jgi:4-hydroxy-tetrahydrodipicolinate reductase
MKIALIGYGKMGKAIEQIALQNGHEIIMAISLDNVHEFTLDNVKEADVAIEFSTPSTAYYNVMKCIDAGVPVICGSTGWLEKLDEVKKYAIENKVGFIYASNFSVGVNIFFEINSALAEMMNKQKQYDVAVEEIHHTQKLDAPSGTAVTIAEQILEQIDNKSKWVREVASNENELAIKSIRQDPAPGTHTVSYTSAIDDIEIKHTAHNRIGFASGAVAAAEFVIGKAGVFTMKDVLFG